ncbi:hypothetical protein CEUSTIGMA_g11852.t1 [Chlamydomonas eustigma]|uniref:tRNA pseudouridine(55) synthase n=1 Tax=Chlamydomonas eustigma TaxID=1157962 RepID=A0A250XNE2_9CHLO|nr:hypothetical protein CEUSTIGMA_g11852.t1 [Chlamydomonas eustigma]|eukprot:GAX84432.1 hypothetical protein CEUSTIGMA_g11852.t1 [Chlamydomonas eustigma]
MQMDMARTSLMLGRLERLYFPGTCLNAYQFKVADTHISKFNVPRPVDWAVSLQYVRFRPLSSRASTATEVNAVTQKTKVIELPKSITVPPGDELVNLKDFENGALLIDKPIGWTSFDVCGKLRSTLKFTGKVKVGHAGTLDPMATGLLIVCTGKGTKACDTFMAMSKSYTGTIRLGEGTNTYDAEARVSERMPWEHITDDEIVQAASSLSGNIMQVPPMFSAIKVKGQKLYDLAREGQVIEREPRPVTITTFSVKRLKDGDPQELHFVVECSKGTYIRSLAYDLGRALGTVAHLTSLRRESIGDFNVTHAWEFPKLLTQLSTHKERLTSVDDETASIS